MRATQTLKKIENYINIAKTNVETIYDYTANGIKVMSKFECNKHGENSTKFFLKLKKKHGIQNSVQKLIVKGKEITDPKEVEHQSVL